MANSFTTPALIALIIGLVVVVIGGPEYQFIKTNTLNDFISLDDEAAAFNEDVNFLQGNESATVTTENSFGLIDNLKLILDFILSIANAIALPLTIMTVSGMPIFVKALLGVPLGLALLLGIAGFVRGTP